MKLCPQCERPLERACTVPDCPCGDAKCVCGWKDHFSFGLDEPRLPNPKPALTYMSIDIETTGLNPETCQILEIGAIYDDWTKPLRELPTFHCYVKHERIVGQPYALALNAATLKKLADPHPNTDDLFLTPDQVAGIMAAWLGNCGWNLSTAITPAGKNFASFDLQFLRRLPDFERKVRLQHRTLDPAVLFWRPADDKLPGSQTCYERAGVSGKVAHTAVEDALAVVQEVRAGIKRLRDPCPTLP
jgi:oligoribonuclease